MQKSREQAGKSGLFALYCLFGSYWGRGGRQADYFIAGMGLSTRQLF